MIFYHFTCEEHIEAILREGLARGEVPLTRSCVLSAPWLTTDPTPYGHGLSFGGAMPRAQERFLRASNPGLPPGRLRLADKSAIRIAVEVPLNDPALVRWQDWAKGRLAPAWYAALRRSGGQRHATWWLYWSVIPVNSFVSVERRLSTGRYGDPVVSSDLAA